VDDDGLRLLLLTLSPTARDKLRRALILDQPDRDAVATELLRYATFRTWLVRDRERFPNDRGTLPLTTARVVPENAFS